MNWSDIGKAVGAAAPMVGTLLGGPAGAAVGALVSSALGVPNDPESVNAVLATNPDALAKVQELQLNAKVQLQQLAVTAENNRLQAEAAQYSAEAADRDSARKLAAQQPRDFIRPSVTIILLLGALLIIAAIFMGWNRDVITDPTAAITVGTVMGLWFSELKQVLGFYFGMTKESQKQNAAITDFAVAPGTVTRSDK
ncbi:hypothetical protein ACIPL1_24645 [Pseudomonas sp. NPDC090202]|uniref:hypothetical protein n=1 Tax=Pseudomonas sp. NPDC090202 TaxID=3364476 RepID=UPI0038000B6F